MIETLGPFNVYSHEGGVENNPVPGVFFPCPGHTHYVRVLLESFVLYNHYGKGKFTRADLVFAIPGE